MSPREKQFILLISLVLFAIVIFALALYYIPTFLYVTFILGLCCIACYYHNGESLFARLGLNPRCRLTIPYGLRRWLTGRTANGVTLSAPGRLPSRSNKADVRYSEVYSRQTPFETGVYRRDALAKESLIFSPRDILMGSYIGKAEGSPAVAGRPRAGRSLNQREQLRERLARPNHAVYTPNRRLSFTGEPIGAMGRFTITPQRHYPLQQSGTSSVGILPPAQWDSFRKKNILSPRNSPALHSPVTVKIARPDHSTPRPPLLDHLSSPGGLGLPGLGSPVDPCSRDTVLKVLKESRKRDVEEDDDGNFTAEQRSKRRRNDSGGSAHSAFEPLLPNGVSSQLVPKPGTLKRGMNSVAEESTMKRSRTSSISSGIGGQAPSGTPGSVRNSIRSSYSSTQGFGQWKKASAQSSPLSSPGSSRSQTPERASKKPREEDAQSPSSASSARSDKTATDTAPITSKLTPVPMVPAAASSDLAGSGGKRKRKIQLVSSCRGDQIFLPPPPELGYTITVKDLDQEKKDALSKIRKVLEEPASEPEKPGPSPTGRTASSQPAPSIDSTTTLSSLLAAPLPTASTLVSGATSIPVINLDPTPTSSVSTLPSAAATSASNPLLEALKMKISAPSSSQTPATAVSTTMTPVEPSGPTLKISSTLEAPQPTPVPLSQLPSTGLGQPSSSMPSAFTQVLAQTTKIPSSTPSVTGSSLFGPASQLTTSVASSSSNTSSSTIPPATSTVSGSSANPLLASGFKPIFVATTMSPATSGQESKPAVPTFKPIFGSAGFTQPPSFTTAVTSVPTASSTSTSSVFGGLTNSSAPAPSLFTGLSNTTSVTAASTSSTTTTDLAAQPAIKSLFGSWSTQSKMSTASTSAPASTTGSAFQFGTAPSTTIAPAAPTAAPTTSSNSSFTFGAMTTMPATMQPATMQPATMQPAPQANTQKVFAFGQAAPSQNQTTASFGGFALANTTATTAAAAALQATQSTFTFGKSSFDTTTAPPAYPNSTAAPPKPFTFGAGGAAAAPATTPAPAPFTFGAAAATTVSTFGTPSKPTFGTGFAFGNTTTPSAAPSFGAVTQTQSAPTASFTFGSAPPQQTATIPAQPASGGFNFGAPMPGTPFGTPIPNNPAPQMASFNFGAAATDKPAFGTSTPTFGQSAAAVPVPFVSPGTPAQGFSSVAPSPFGSSGTPSFSIGAGSKPSGARQRLQARRQHARKK
ncbi:nuclear envelope pore membrane protein POM 121 [Polymixia lowei]